MRFVRLFIVIIFGIFWLSACLPGGQGVTQSSMAVSPIPKSTEIIATVTHITPPTHTMEPSPTLTAERYTPTPELKPTSLPPTTSAIPADWQVYTNPQHGFEVSYPPGNVLVEDEPDHARIDLPFQADTTLQEKYLTIDLTPLQSDGTCASPFAAGYAAEAVQRETVNVGEKSFLRESGSEGAAGSTYEWVAYSSAHEQGCVSLTFILHSTNAANYEVPPPEFDSQAEKDVFERIVSTFYWLD